MRHSTISIFAILSTALLFTITGCGGSGSGKAAIRDIAGEPQPPQQTRSEPLTYPLRAWPQDHSGTQHYGTSKLPMQGVADGHRMPIYHDSSHFGEHGTEAPKRRIFVGIDQTKFHLRHHPIVSRRDNADVRYGKTTTDATIATMNLYRELHGGARIVYQRMRSPTVRITSQATPHDIDRVVRAVQLVNAALPSESKITVSPEPFGPGDLREDANTIYININSSVTQDYDNDDSNPNAIGSTWYLGATSSLMRIYTHQKENGATEADDTNRRTTMLLAHELIHALGVDGHVVNISNSLMRASIQSNFPIRQEQPLSLLFPIDRDILQVMHKDIDILSYGPWSNERVHVHGNSEHAGFGASWRNGFAEPWAYGYMASDNIADNDQLSGQLRWSGELVGFEPDSSVVAGDARIAVDLERLRGSAHFTNLESWSAGSAPGDEGEGSQWGDGDLLYLIDVDGNTFHETGGDDGTLTGIFVGENHEGVAGTLERDDLVAAFGASR